MLESCIFGWVKMGARRECPKGPRDRKVHLAVVSTDALTACRAARSQDCRCVQRALVHMWKAGVATQAKDRPHLHVQTRLGRDGREEVRVTSVEDGHDTRIWIGAIAVSSQYTIVWNMKACRHAAEESKTYPTRKSLPAAVPRATLVPW
jgi:hypothetical protein